MIRGPAAPTATLLHGACHAKPDLKHCQSAAPGQHFFYLTKNKKQLYFYQSKFKFLFHPVSALMLTISHRPCGCHSQPCFVHASRVFYLTFLLILVVFRLGIFSYRSFGTVVVGVLSRPHQNYKTT